MSAAACARAASDLTALVHRLGRTRAALVRQSRLPEQDFGGLSGDAYRRHAARSAVTVAGAGSDLALLAGALAALGRELAAAEEIRVQAHGSPPERARELRLRARDLERRAQDRWRAAVAAYEGQAGPAPQPTGQPIGQPVVAGTVLGPTVPASPEPAVSPPTAATPVVPPPAAPEPVAATAAASGPALESALVAATPGSGSAPESALVSPPPQLESELVVPATPPPHCGTPEALDELR